MNDRAATVVLVHGAWHGAWCWRTVRDELDRAGIPSVAVDNPSVLAATATLADDADAVHEVLDAVTGPVVLVGHSYGGAVITDAGAHDAVRHLVYVAAFALDEGESVTQNALTGGEHGGALEAAVQFDGEVLRLDPAGARAAFYHDCTDAIADDAVARLRAQAFAALAGTPRSVAWRTKPSTYVLCTQDRAVLPPLQRSAAARTANTVEIAASHSPFLSRPAELARALVALATA